MSIPAGIGFLPRHALRERTARHDDLTETHCACYYGYKANGEYDSESR